MTNPRSIQRQLTLSCRSAVYSIGFDKKKIFQPAEIEGTYYGRLTKVEEFIAFAKRIGAKKISIATCLGLINETKIFCNILAVKGLENYSFIL